MIGLNTEDIEYSAMTFRLQVASRYIFEYFEWYCLKVEIKLERVFTEQKIHVFTNIPNLWTFLCDQIGL